MRNRVFYSFEEFNQALRHYLEWLNHQAKDYGVSQVQRFEEEKNGEKPGLKN